MFFNIYVKSTYGHNLLISNINHLMSGVTNMTKCSDLLNLEGSRGQIQWHASQVRF